MDAAAGTADVTRAVEVLARVARQVSASLDLPETLEAVAAAVVQALGFGVAVVNVIDGDEVVAVAVAGRDDVRRALLGTRSPMSAWAAMTGAAEDLGGVLYLDHRTPVPDAAAGIQMWVPPVPAPEDGAAEGRWHPLDSIFAPLRAASGALLGMLSVDVPDDRRKPSRERCALLAAFAVHAAIAVEHAREHSRVLQSERAFQRLFDSSPVAKALCGADGTFVRVNFALCEFLGRRPDELLGHRSEEFTHPDDIAASDLASQALRQDGGTLWRMEKRYIDATGRVVWGRLSLVHFDDDGAGVTVLATIEDITQARAAQDALRHQAMHDGLTGLPNRLLAHDRIDRAVAVARRTGESVAVAFCDLDHFKVVNDTHGHAVGDLVLREAAHRLAANLRPGDTAARLGGDEFVLVLTAVDAVHGAVAAVDRLRTAVGAPLHIAGADVTASMSVGAVVLTPGAPPLTAEQLLAAADLALYRAKAEGRDRCAVYDPTVDRPASPTVPDQRDDEGMAVRSA